MLEQKPKRHGVLCPIGRRIAEEDDRPRGYSSVMTAGG
jgi:hypothetical protein